MAYKPVSRVLHHQVNYMPHKVSSLVEKGIKVQLYLYGSKKIDQKHKEYTWELFFNTKKIIVHSLML